MSDLEKLRALAERAIWGAWRSRRSQFPSTPSFEIETELPCINGLSAWVPIAFLPVPMRAETEMTDGVISPKSAEATAAFIAAAHPAAILDLIARVPVSQAGRDVLAERSRQIGVELFSAEHDDGHPGELARAAACYAKEAGETIESGNTDTGWIQRNAFDWPWEAQAWKPKNVRRDLVRAAALIIAEIERMDRHQNV